MLLFQTPITQASTTTEPLLFENIGQLVSGLSYVHTHIPINISQLEENLRLYKNSIINELSEDNLRVTYQGYIHQIMTQQQLDANQTMQKLKLENLQYVKSTLTHWPQIGKIHLQEIDALRSRIQTLYLTLPQTLNPHESMDTQHMEHTETHSFSNLSRKLVTDEAHPDNSPYSPKRNYTRPKRFIPFVIGGIVAAATATTAGTAFGIMNRQSLESLSQKVKEIGEHQAQVVKVLQEINRDIIELQDATHELVIMSFADRNFDSAVMLSKLRYQLNSLLDFTYRIECAIQQAQHHRLAINFLSHKNLMMLFHQVRNQAKMFGYQTVIERPSELFQLDASYAYDGKVISLLLHVPIAPPDAFMRLYKLHPFPLPFDNGTLLTHNVKNEILAISNSNHRYTIQMSTVDLLGCHRLGKLYLCERNGLLNKYPEDTCLGSLYHQKFEIAHQLCDFRVEPAKEFIYQLLNNWFMVYEPTPITVPIVCTNGSHAELHVRKGISKFHLTAGCTADFPRYRLLSDISILIPQDYIQLEMDWDPVSFMPGVREYLLPEIQKLGRLGATTTSLATLQSMVASRLEDISGTFHWVHFGFNGITISLVLGLVCLIGYRAFVLYQRRCAQDQARKVDLAVRTALNRNVSQSNLYIPDGDMTIDHFDSISNHPPRAPSAAGVRFVNNRMSYVHHNNLNDPLGEHVRQDDLHLKYPSL